MSKVVLHLTNKVTIIEGIDRKILQRLNTVTSYLVEGYYFSPAYKAHRWDGREQLLKFSTSKGYHFPSGLIVPICRELMEMEVDFEIVDETVVRHRREPFDFSAPLRDYQVEAVDAALGRPFPGRGILKLPIRSGKTRVGAAVLARIGLPSVFLVPSKGLLYQTREAFEEYLPGVAIGLIGDGVFEVETVTVATLQTLALLRGVKAIKGKRKGRPRDPRYNDLMTAFDVVLADECFPAGTMVDGSPIEDVRAGDLIETYNEKTGKVGCGLVTRLFVREARTLCEIHTERGSIVCTPNHPFMSDDGWVDACELREGDLILRRSNYVGRKSCVHSLRKDGESFWKKERVLQANRACVLQHDLFQRCKGGGFVKDNGGYEPKTCVGTHEEEQPHEACVCEKEATCIVEGASSTNSGRQRARRDHGAEDANVLAVVHCDRRLCLGVRCEDEQESGEWLPYKLQGRPCCPGSEACDRSGRKFSQCHRDQEERQKERESFEWVRVDSVEIHEREGSPRFRELCPNGLVYNLEVETDETYIANGFVVHNCHHIRGGGEWHNVLLDLDARYKIGLSATAFVDSETEQARGAIWMLATCGPVRKDVSVSRLVEDGYLMRQHVHLYKVKRPDYTDHKWSRTMHARCIVENVHRNGLIAKIAHEHVEAGRKVLVIAKLLRHIELLREAMEDLNLTVASVVGKTTTEDRRWAVESLEEGAIDVLLSNVMGEGIDLPCVNVVINAEGGKDQKVTIQRQRNLTLSEGKTEAIFVDFIDQTNRHLLKHSKQRVKVYKSEPMFVVEVKK